MRVVFMGTPDFAVPALQEMIREGYEVAAVVTQPDRARGRGKAVTFSPVKTVAVSHNIAVLQPARARDPQFIMEVEELCPDVIVVVAFGQILPKEILEIPPYGCINVHASLLPKWRGAAPIQWAVINGDARSGVTTMYMAEGLDTGDMIYQEEVVLDAQETAGSLSDRLSVCGARLLIRTLQEVEAGNAPRIPQDDAQAGPYARMLKKEMGYLDFSRPAAELQRLIRGLDPWPSAWTYLHGKTLKIWSAEVDEKEYEGVCGEIVAVRRDAFLVKTAEGALVIRQLQPEGKKRMDAAAFLRGYPLKEGELLPMTAGGER